MRDYNNQKRSVYSEEEYKRMREVAKSLEDGELQYLWD